MRFQKVLHENQLKRRLLRWAFGFVVFEIAHAQLHEFSRVVRNLLDILADVAHLDADHHDQREKKQNRDRHQHDRVNDEIVCDHVVHDVPRLIMAIASVMSSLDARSFSEKSFCGKQAFSMQASAGGNRWTGRK